MVPFTSGIKLQTAARSEDLPQRTRPVTPTRQPGCTHKSMLFNSNPVTSALPCHTNDAPEIFTENSSASSFWYSAVVEFTDRVFSSPCSSGNCLSVDAKKEERRWLTTSKSTAIVIVLDIFERGTLRILKSARDVNALVAVRVPSLTTVYMKKELTDTSAVDDPKTKPEKHATIALLLISCISLCRHS